MPPKPSRSKATKFPRPIHTERAAELLVAPTGSQPVVRSNRGPQPLAGELPIGRLLLRDSGLNGPFGSHSPIHRRGYKTPGGFDSLWNLQVRGIARRRTA